MYDLICQIYSEYLSKLVDHKLGTVSSFNQHFNGDKNMKNNMHKYYHPSLMNFGYFYQITYSWNENPTNVWL